MWSCTRLPEHTEFITPLPADTAAAVDAAPIVSSDAIDLPQDSFSGTDAVHLSSNYTLNGTLKLLGKLSCGNAGGFISDIDAGWVGCTDFEKSWITEFNADGIGKSVEIPQTADQILHGGTLFFTGQNTKTAMYGTGAFNNGVVSWENFQPITVTGKSFTPSFGKGLALDSGELVVVSSNLSFTSGGAEYFPGTALVYNGSGTMPTAIPTDGFNPTSLGAVILKGELHLVVVNTENYKTNSSITLINPKTYKIMPLIPLDRPGMGIAGEISSFGARIALGSGDNSGAVAIVDLDTQAVTTLHTAVSKQGESHLISVAVFSPDGQRLMTGDYNTGTLQQWDVSGKTPIAIGGAIVVDSNLADNAGISDAIWMGGKFYVAVGKEIWGIE